MVKGQDTGSGVNKVETTAGVWQQSGFTCSAADSFQHTQNLKKCCFTSTETVGLLGTGAQDVHLDFHTAPEL